MRPDPCLWVAGMAQRYMSGTWLSDDACRCAMKPRHHAGFPVALGRTHPSHPTNQHAHAHACPPPSCLPTTRTRKAGPGYLTTAEYIGFIWPHDRRVAIFSFPSATTTSQRNQHQQYCETRAILSQSRSLRQLCRLANKLLSFGPSSSTRPEQKKPCHRHFASWYQGK